jgi:two-component system sensor histidine kinase TctE
MRGNSIRLRLLYWLVGPLAVIGLVGGFATYWLAWIPARNAYDLALANAAWELATRLQTSSNGLLTELPLQIEQGLRADRFDQIFFCVHDRNGILLNGDRGLPAAPVPHDLDTPVYYDGDYGGLAVRLVSLPTLSAGELVIVTVAETTLKRQRGQRTIIVTLVTWGLALTCAIVVIGWLATGRALSRLDRLQSDIAKRSLRDLAPIDESVVPIEVKPLAAAINALLERIAEAARAQQSFLTDVAHQLRTPLAGLITQLSVAERQSDTAEVRKSIAVMQGTATRTVRLANQLLALARAEPSGFHAERLRPLQLTDIIQRCINDWVRLADQKSIELHFDLNPAPVLGDEFLLRELLDNLLTNAVLYTPAGGHVVIGCHASDGGSLVFVEDSGSGIPPAERLKVFNRFYRMPGTSADGSGLGLTIAREIARDHLAEIEIATPAAGTGTRVEVRFPAKAG